MTRTTRANNPEDMTMATFQQIEVADNLAVAAARVVFDAALAAGVEETIAADMGQVEWRRVYAAELAKFGG